MIGLVKTHVLDFVYPRFCVGCESDSDWLCEPCSERIVGRGSEADSVDIFDQFFTIGSYADPALRELIRSIKYRRAIDCLPSVSRLIDRFIKHHALFHILLSTPNLQIFYVPSDELRVRERGVDHVADLANLVHAKYPETVLRDTLIKTRTSIPNAKLPSNAARKGNSLEAFAVTERVSRPCLLIDDVYTTGATMKACKRALKAAGAKNIHGFTLAKG